MAKYAIAVPRAGEPGHETDVVLVEEYTDDDAYRAHMFSPPVKELFAVGRGPPVLLSSPPVFHHIPAAVNFTRPEASKAKNPVLIQASFGYEEGRSTDSLEGWRPLVENAEKNEPGVLFYAVLDDTEVRNLGPVM